MNLFKELVRVIEKQIILLKIQILINPETKVQKEKQIKGLREMLLEKYFDEQVKPTISLISNSPKNTATKLSILGVFKECNIDEEDYFYYKERDVFQILKQEDKQYNLSDKTPIHTAIKSAFENYQINEINIIKF